MGGNLNPNKMREITTADEGWITRHTIGRSVYRSTEFSNVTLLTKGYPFLSDDDVVIVRFVVALLLLL